MSTLDAVILALIQGITEWLPVSSSGHLALYHHVKGLEEPFLYSVLLHFSSFFVIAVFFRKKITGIIRSMSAGGNREEGKSYLVNIVIGSLPAAAAGLFFRGRISDAFGDMRIIAAAWIFTAVALAASGFSREKTAGVTRSRAFIIGLSQAFALIPGISRSGITISAAMLSGIRREEAAEFSFLLALPALFGAGILELSGIGSPEGLMLFSLGAVISFAAGLIALSALMKIIKAGKFSRFSIYCLVLGITMLFA